jgi:hypothetical protein
LNGAVSKTVVGLTVHRGFESLPLRWLKWPICSAGRSVLDIATSVAVRDRPDLRDGRAAASGVALGPPRHPPQRDRHEHRSRGAGRRALLADRLDATICWSRRRPPCWPAQSASGCSMCSTSWRTPTGRATRTGASRAGCGSCRRCCSSSRGTSACTTYTTSARASRTTTCSVPTTRTRSSTTCVRHNRVEVRSPRLTATSNRMSPVRIGQEYFLSRKGGWLLSATYE